MSHACIYFSSDKSVAVIPKSRCILRGQFAPSEEVDVSWKDASGERSRYLGKVLQIGPKAMMDQYAKLSEERIKFWVENGDSIKENLRSIIDITIEEDPSDVETATPGKRMRKMSKRLVESKEQEQIENVQKKRKPEQEEGKRNSQKKRKTAAAPLKAIDNTAVSAGLKIVKHINSSRNNDLDLYSTVYSTAFPPLNTNTRPAQKQLQSEPTMPNPEPLQQIHKTPPPPPPVLAPLGHQRSTLPPTTATAAATTKTASIASTEHRSIFPSLPKESQQIRRQLDHQIPLSRSTPPQQDNQQLTQSPNQHLIVESQPSRQPGPSPSLPQNSAFPTTSFNAENRQEMSEIRHSNNVEVGNLFRQAMGSLSDLDNDYLHQYELNTIQDESDVEDTVEDIKQLKEKIAALEAENQELKKELQSSRKHPIPSPEVCAFLKAYVCSFETTCMDLLNDHTEPTASYTVKANLSPSAEGSSNKVRLLENVDVFVERNKLRTCTSGALSKGPLFLLQKLIPLVFSIEELANSCGQGMSNNNGKPGPSSTKKPALNSIKVNACKDFVTAFCVKNNKEIPPPKAINETFTSQVSYSRVKLKRSAGVSNISATNAS